MSLRRIVEPTVEPVDVADLRRHARAGDSAEELLSMQACIAAARAHVEEYTMRSLVTQTWQMTIDEAFPTSIYLRRPPVQSITSISYVDQDGIEQTLDASAYQADLNIEPALVRVAYGTKWPVPRSALAAVRVTYIAGYGDVDIAVPAPIRQAILMIATSMFDNRGAESFGWDAAASLLETYRVLEIV